MKVEDLRKFLHSVPSDSDVEIYAFEAMDEPEPVKDVVYNLVDKTLYLSW